MSSDDSDPAPTVHVRWYHAGHGLGHLDLLATPVAKIAMSTWTSFTREESDRCEEAWLALNQEERDRALRGAPIEETGKPPDDDEEEHLILGVPIGKERLFEVDVRTLRMYAVYWKITGPPIPVIRAIWMHDHTRPVEGKLHEQIETAYNVIKPWKASYKDELRAATELGSYEKLRHTVIENEMSIFFDDASTARIISHKLAQRLSSAIVGTFSRANAGPFPGAPIVYRGYDEALLRAKPLQSRPATPSPASTPSRQNVNLPKGGSHPFRPKSLDGKLSEVAQASSKGEISIQEANIEAQLVLEAASPGPTGSKVGEGDSEDVTDLILVIHGIGQGLTAHYEAFNFVYATNLMRQVARKQAMSPALASIMRSHNVQYLPVQWRTSFKLDDAEEKQREADGLDNKFSLSDITIKRIPAIRELTNEVLIDIPYFMSRHQISMVESVCAQANRLYRLWCARNPKFSTKGRVHIIAHSLGSVLAAHILSRQPTRQKPLNQMTDEEQHTTSQFIFDTSTLFTAGSPVGVFAHLERAQIIARKGRERTMNSPSDEALDRVGLFGCLSVDSLYNVFYPNDPVAYKINPCVDSKRARELPPFVIPNVNEGFFYALSKGMSKMFDGFIPFGAPTSANSAAPQQHGNSDEETTFELELGGGGNKLQGSRAERRFLALNPHGCLDFMLPGEGGLNDYVDMLTAHSAYWGDGSLAAFMLAEIFARREDLVRTGFGPLQVSLDA